MAGTFKRYRRLDARLGAAVNVQEYDELVDRVAQEVMNRIATRDRVSRLTDAALARLKESEGQGGRQSGLTTTQLAPESVRKIILKHFRSPGDVLMLTAAVRDLVLSHPGRFQVDVRTPYPALWENNPHLTPLNEGDPEVEVLDCDYCDHPLITESNHRPYHFIHAFRLLLEERLGVPIRPQAFKGDIHLTEQEKDWWSQVDEITEQPGARFWIIASGGKTDFTAKWWDPARSQTVVDHFRDRIQFVQVGAAYDDHVHPLLEGVINLVGRTDLRQMVRLMYHADGVVCPVTMLMHLAAAVETKPGRPCNRPCVVVAGGREPSQWEAYPHHQYLHTNGCLPCCDDGGCWKSRVVARGDGTKHDESLCEFPVAVSSGHTLPACMDMITVERVIAAIELCLRYERPLTQYVPQTAADKPLEARGMGAVATEESIPAQLGAAA
jgi:ADP-heptose:LPS heptosyltransferase